MKKILSFFALSCLAGLISIFAQVNHCTEYDKIDNNFIRTIAIGESINLQASKEKSLMNAKNNLTSVIQNLYKDISKEEIKRVIGGAKTICMKTTTSGKIFQTSTAIELNRNVLSEYTLTTPTASSTNTSTNTSTNYKTQSSSSSNPSTNEKAAVALLVVGALILGGAAIIKSLPKSSSSDSYSSGSSGSYSSNSSTTSNTTGEDNISKNKGNIDDCVKRMKSKKAEETKTDGNMFNNCPCIQYSIGSSLNGWTYFYFNSQNEYYVDYRVKTDLGPFNSLSEAIQAYCEDEYK